MDFRPELEDQLNEELRELRRQVATEQQDSLDVS